MEVDTITTWFHRLADGDQQAAEQIWQRYWTQMLGHARAKLAKRPLRASDEEDVALSAMHSFWKRRLDAIPRRNWLRSSASKSRICSLVWIRSLFAKLLCGNSKAFQTTKSPSKFSGQRAPWNASSS